MPECAFTSPVIIESGMLVCSLLCLYRWCLWCLGVVFLGDIYMLAMVMPLKCFVRILKSCMSVLMTGGVLMCVNVVSDLMYVMRPPHCLCSLPVRMAVKCGIGGGEF